MSAKHLRREPQHIKGDETWWWYEGARGLEIVVEAHPEGRTRVVDIPWGRIRSALKRKDRKP